jgi:hypothetical protein
MLKSIDTTAIASLNDTARRTLTGFRVQMTPVEKIVKLEKKDEPGAGAVQGCRG